MIFSPLGLIILGIISFFNLCIGGYVLMQNLRHPVNRSFFIMVTGIVIWTVGLILLWITKQFDIYNSVILYGGLVMVSGLVLFSTTFPYQQSFPEWVPWLFIPMMIIAIGIPFDWFILGASITSQGIEPINGNLFPFFAIVSGMYMVFSLLKIIATYSTSHQEERNRFKYFFLGFGIFILISLIADVILPLVGIFSVNMLGPISSLVLISTTAYAIVRHNIMDIRLVIQRGLIYTCLVGLCISIYIFLIFFTSIIFHTSDTYSAFISAGIAVILGIFGVPPLENYFRKITNRWFFKDRYDYAESLFRLSRILNTAITRETIIEQCQVELAAIFKSEPVTIVFGSSLHEPYHSNTLVNLYLPILFENQIMGHILVGSKRSGDFYTSQDIRLVETFAHQAGVALEKARLYDEVREYSLGLEQIVKQRTQTIQQILEDQRQSMTDISHSLQTPLSVLTNQIELLEGSSVHPIILTTCRHAITSVSQFVRRMLRLVVLESSSSEEYMEPINFSELLMVSSDYYATMAESEQVSYISAIDPGIMIRGNRELIEELVLNLVTNAIKYARPKGMRTLTVQLVEAPEGVCFSVTDNGIGISPDHLSTIFKRLYRIKRSGNRASGSGLGLAICKRISDMHHASIIVKSIPNKGSSFSVTFPRLVI